MSNFRQVWNATRAERLLLDDAKEARDRVKESTQSFYTKLTSKMDDILPKEWNANVQLSLALWLAQDKESKAMEDATAYSKIANMKPSAWNKALSKARNAFPRVSSPQKTPTKSTPKRSARLSSSVSNSRPVSPYHTPTKSPNRSSPRLQLFSHDAFTSQQRSKELELLQLETPTKSHSKRAAEEAAVLLIKPTTKKRKASPDAVSNQEEENDVAHMLIEHPGADIHQNGMQIDEMEDEEDEEADFKALFDFQLSWSYSHQKDDFDEWRKEILDTIAADTHLSSFLCERDPSFFSRMEID